MGRPVLVVAALCLIPQIAWAQGLAEVTVTDWTPAAKSAPVMVYSREGVAAKPLDPGSVVVAGKHLWNRAYDIVDIGGDRWIERKKLTIKLCGNDAPAQGPHFVADGGSSQRKANTGYGSGNPCN